MTTDNCAVMMGKTKLWNQNLNRLFQIYLQIDIQGPPKNFPRWLNDINDIANMAR